MKNLHQMLDVYVRTMVVILKKKKLINAFINHDIGFYDERKYIIIKVHKSIFYLEEYIMKSFEFDICRNIYNIPYINNYNRLIKSSQIIPNIKHIITFLIIISAIIIQNFVHLNLLNVIFYIKGIFLVSLAKLDLF